MTAEDRIAQLEMELARERARTARVEAENVALRQQREAFLVRLRKVEGQLAKDSHNSGKPPSNHDRGKTPDEESFWQQVDIRGECECWPWLDQTRNGYARFYVRSERKSRKASRVAYALSKGPIPEGLRVLHSCDNPLCVNPAHLSVGTQNDNIQDMIRKGRIATGEKNGRSKLREDDISKIRKMRDDGIPQHRIAEIFGVSQQQISRICLGKLWSHASTQE